jgi:hypothetical protein
LRLVHFELRLTFAEKLHEFTLSEKIREALTGEISKKNKDEPEESVQVRFSKNKLAVRWTKESFWIAQEESLNIDDFIKNCDKFLEKINTLDTINKFKEKRLITHWLLPMSNYNFPELVKKYREVMLAQNSIYNDIIDSSALFDIKIGEGVLSHQSGPMKISQLQNGYLLFKQDDLPKLSIFLIASIKEEKVLDYSIEDVNSFISRTHDFCKSHSDVISRIWEGVL